jgi:glucosamine--fructose-6-phosphate aminotransferase (isomerizing)
MYSDLPGDVRDRHPYHMYEEIKAQPDAVERSLQFAAEQGGPVVGVIAGARRVFVIGCGTSFHAALGGAWFLQSFSRGSIDARAVEAYEFLTYHPALQPNDVVIAVTHSGETTMVLRALERAQRAGAETVAVTGFPDKEAGRRARYVLPTGYNDERSWAHTASYTAALTTLAALANNLAQSEERLDLSPLPAVMREALQIEEMVHRLAAGAIVADRYRDPADLFLVGGGPNAGTAREAQLKLLETSYGHALCFELEEMLHGPLAATTAESLLIVIAPTGRSVERSAELVRAAGAIGTTPVVLTGEESVESFPDAHRLLLPEVPEVLTPIPFVVPLQFFAYFLSIGNGLNPDLLRREDERYRAARAAYA